MAQAALTLNELTGGRFRLGIGVSHQAMMSGMLGLGVVEPLTVMREYVAVLRGALSGAAAFEGKYYRAHWSLALPTRPPAPPIYLAALGPKMCELAGEIADGAILWLCPPDYVRDVARPAIERGRWRAGKTLEGFVIACAVPLAVTDDRDRRAGGVSHRADALRRPAVLPHHDGGQRPAARRCAAYDRDSAAVPESMATTLGGDRRRRHRARLSRVVPPRRRHAAGRAADHLPRRAVVPPHARGGRSLVRGLAVGVGAAAVAAAVALRVGLCAPAARPAAECDGAGALRGARRQHRGGHRRQLPRRARTSRGSTAGCAASIRAPP